MLPWVCGKIPGPFSISHTNCYLIASEPLSLIDPGSYTEQSIVALKDFLSGEGYSFRDVKRVLITHAHVDHFGLAGFLQRHGAEVYVGLNDVAKVEHTYSHLQSWWDLFIDRAGCPAEFLEELRPYLCREREYTHPIEGVRGLEQNFTLDFADGRLKVLNAPGHCSGQVVFTDVEGQLFSGDFLLPQIFSSPVMEYWQGSWNNPLADMFAACGQLEQLEVELVLPAHGEPFDGYRNRIKELKEFQLAKSREVVDLITRGRTIYEAARQMFPRARGWDLAVGVGQCLAYVTYWDEINGNIGGCKE